MSVRTRVEPIARDVELVLAETLSPEARSQALAAFARDQLAEAQAGNEATLGRRPGHETFVDGRRGAPVESVRPDGTIVFAFDVVQDLLAWIGEQLVLYSPVRSGRYAASHVFFADGVQMEPGAATPAAEEYAFVNVLPYARKIERGLSPQAPDGVYEGVALYARRRFGNVARIAFTYRQPLSGAVVDWAGSRSLPEMRPNARRRQLHQDVRNPAIVIRTK